MENNIIKVISGNASQAEIDSLNQWIELSAENKALFEQHKNLWNLLGKADKTPEVDVDAAWEKFSVLKEAPQQKNYLIYKIAAVFIVFLTVGSFMFMFTNKGENDFGTQIANKNHNKSFPKNTTIQVAENASPQKLKDLKIRKTRKVSDSYTYNEYVFVDSSKVITPESSTLNFLDNTNSQTRIASLSGAGFFDIKPLDKDFVLETQDLHIKVQGTKFNIVSDTKNNKFVEISVEDGVMEVYEKQNPSNKITISSKQKFIYDTDSHLFIEKTTKEETKWKKFINKIFK